MSTVLPANSIMLLELILVSFVILSSHNGTIKMKQEWGILAS